MHGSSLYVYASVYRCICTDRVYMYMRVFIGVYARIEFICMFECLYVYMHGSSYIYVRMFIGVYARIEFIYMCECL